MKTRARRGLLAAFLLLGVALVSMQVRGARSFRSVRFRSLLPRPSSAPVREPAGSGMARRGPSPGPASSAHRAGPGIDSTAGLATGPFTQAMEGRSHTAPRDDSMLPARQGGPVEMLPRVQGPADATALIPSPGQGPAGLLPAFPPPNPPAINPSGATGSRSARHEAPSSLESPGAATVTPPLNLALVPDRPGHSSGDRFQVEVVLSQAREVTSVPLHIRFNPEVLDFLGATTGPALKGSAVQSVLLASVNPRRPDDLAVGLAMIGSPGTFTGSGAMISLRFRALRPGRSDLLLEQASVRGATGDPLPARMEGSRITVR